MIEDVEKVIRDYIPEVIHMSLATVSDQGPWVCEVHFVYDHDLNLYFRSRSNTRHSQEIAENPKVAGTIHQKHGITDPPRGVYFEGQAKLMEDGGERKAVAPLFKRFELDPDDPDDILVSAAQVDGFKFYKIEVETFYLFDARESKPPKKYELKLSL
jgi:uncharacterized protein YhbP (UPF0306 family)